MGLSILRSRKGAHPIMALVMGAVVLFIGIYTVMQVVNSITLPTLTTSESITFTNATFASVSNPYINNVISITNSTPITLGSGNYTWTSTQINVTFICTAGYCESSNAWDVAYTYNLRQANDTFGTTQTTFWNSMQLGAVSLITLAASLVLGSFFFA